MLAVAQAVGTAVEVLFRRIYKTHARVCAGIWNCWPINFARGSQPLRDSSAELACHQRVDHFFLTYAVRRRLDESGVTVTVTVTAPMSAGDSESAKPVSESP